MVSNLFTTITAQHWKLELARARSTPNSISAQIRAALCRGEKQADGKPTRTASAVDLPASPARTSTLPDVVGVLTADVLGSVAGVGHPISQGDQTHKRTCRSESREELDAPAMAKKSAP